ncbi:MAG: hypothetical protein K2W33_05670, partial [Burkholderiales bacterium]|nr:hypothetical protein [Burkholderiales bacterium]
TRAYSGTNLGAYRQGGSSATKRLIRVDDSQIAITSYVYYRAYEAMTAVSTGTNPFPTVAQVSAGIQVYYPYAGTPLSWIVIGTPRAFALYICSTTGAMDTFARTMFFGDLARVTKPADTYHCMIGTEGFPASGFYLSRAASGTYGPVLAQISSVGGVNASSLGARYPCTASGNLHLFDAPAVSEQATTVLRGFLPGMLSCVQAPVHNGGASALVPGAILSDITGVTGRVAIMGAATGAATDCAMLLDEDWGDT